MKFPKSSGVVNVYGKLENGAYACKVQLTKLEYASYQRGLMMCHVNRILKDWDVTAARLLCCSWRDGHMYNVDGQHTAHALVEKNYFTWDAEVFVNQTFDDEARTFFRRNDIIKRMAGWKKFDAALKAGNPCHQQILDTIQGFDLTTPLSPEISKPGAADITSCGAVMEAYEKGGVILLSKVCKVLAKAWRVNGAVDTDAKQIDILRGLYRFLHGANDLNMVAFLNLARRYPPTAIKDLAKRCDSAGRVDHVQYRQAFEQIARAA